MRTVRFYRRSLGAHLRAVLEYQSDFWLLISAGVLTQSLGLIFLSCVFARVPTLDGWTYPQMVLIYGLAGLTQAVVPLVSDGIWLLGTQIHHGELDYRLVRPYPAILQVMSTHVGFSGFGDLIGGGALTVWALTRLDVPWNAVTIGYGLLLFGCAAIIRIAITVASNAVSFWLPSPLPMFASAVFQVGELARYPLSIYGYPLRVVVSALVPFAFTAFFPAAWLLDRRGYATLGMLTPVVAVVAAAVAYGLFQLGLRRYESAGN